MIREDRELHGLPHIDNVDWYSDAEEARRVNPFIPSLLNPLLIASQVTRSRTAIEAYTYKAGSIWPHKLVRNSFFLFHPLNHP
jgi:hypothetical protein